MNLICEPIKMIHRYGESGHPCLTPLEGLNQSVAKPLFKAALSMSMWILIHLLKLSSDLVAQSAE